MIGAISRIGSLSPLVQGVVVAALVVSAALLTAGGYRVGHWMGDSAGYTRADTEWTNRQELANAVADARIAAIARERDAAIDRAKDALASAETAAAALAERNERVIASEPDHPDERLPGALRRLLDDLKTGGR